MAVGVFDSGLGGLTVLDAVSGRMPWQSFIYYGDNANTPYGVRESDDIYKLTTTGLEKLWDEGCDLVILACNTASAAALRSSNRWSLAPASIMYVSAKAYIVHLRRVLTLEAWPIAILCG